MKKSDTVKGAVLGIASGALALLNPSAILICTAISVFLALRSKLHLVRAVKMGAVFTAAAILVILPWTIRNYSQFGEFVLIRTNLGLELAVANNDCAEVTLQGNGRNGCHDLMHPNANPAEAALLRQIGEVAYNRRKLAEAKAWIATHPARFAELTIHRAGRFWFPEVNPGFAPYAYAIWFGTAISFIGLFQLVRRGRDAGSFVLLTSGIYSTLYYIVQADATYRYPVFWMALVPAGYFLNEQFGRIWRLIAPIPPFSARARTEK
jgi:hypothetical protein